MELFTLTVVVQTHTIDIFLVVQVISGIITKERVSEFDYKTIRNNNIVVFERDVCFH